jgi:hypothetical protein
LLNSNVSDQEPGDKIANSLPPQQWLQEPAPRLFEGLWSDGYMLDGEAITFKINWRDECKDHYQDVGIFKYKMVNKKVKPAPGIMPNSARVVC